MRCIEGCCEGAEPVLVSAAMPVSLTWLSVACFLLAGRRMPTLPSCRGSQEVWLILSLQQRQIRRRRARAAGFPGGGSSFPNFRRNLCLRCRRVGFQIKDQATNTDAKPCQRVFQRDDRRQP